MPVVKFHLVDEKVLKVWKLKGANGFLLSNAEGLACQQ